MAAPIVTISDLQGTVLVNGITFVDTSVPNSNRFTIQTSAISAGSVGDDFLADLPTGQVTATLQMFDGTTPPTLQFTY